MKNIWALQDAKNRFSEYERVCFEEDGRLLHKMYYSPQKPDIHILKQKYNGY